MESVSTTLKVSRRGEGAHEVRKVRKERSCSIPGPASLTVTTDPSPPLPRPQPASPSLPRYFLSLVLQFQFNRSTLQGLRAHMGPLHHCDIYNSKEAGKLLE